jgi:hypothetical protein
MSSAYFHSVERQNLLLFHADYASFAAAACIGPVDALHAIYLNNEPVYVENAELRAYSLTRIGAVGFPGIPDRNLSLKALNTTADRGNKK